MLQQPMQKHTKGNPFTLAVEGDRDIKLEIIIMTMPPNLHRALVTAETMCTLLEDRCAGHPHGQIHIWSAFQGRPHQLSGHIGLWCSLVNCYLPEMLLLAAQPGRELRKKTFLILEDDAVPAKGLQAKHIVEAIQNWRKLQSSNERFSAHPTAVCTLGFHKRCDHTDNGYCRHHYLDVRPKHGLHAWLLDCGQIQDVLDRLKWLDPLQAPPIDVWFYEHCPNLVAHTIECLFGYSEHQSDTESFHRPAQVECINLATQATCPTIVVPLAVHPTC